MPFPLIAALYCGATKRTINIMAFRKLKKLALAALVSAGVLPVMGQDLLASQAPIDRAMKAVDSIALRQIITIEERGVPATSLYGDWDNVYVNRVGNVPETFQIDLRSYAMPTDRRRITSNFGPRRRRQHKGIDVKVYVGDTIRAAFDGKVRIVQYNRRGYGKYVVIRHYNGLETVYGHLSKQMVVENQEVRAGEPIGLGGNTGRSTGSHLHFETRLCGVAINPALMFDFANQDIVGDFFTFNRATHYREGLAANRLRGAGTKPTNASLDQAGVSTPVPTAPAVKTTRFHKVRSGETLTSIARKRGTTINALCKLNRISKNVRLMPGQILKYN